LLCNQLHGNKHDGYHHDDEKREEYPVSCAASLEADFALTASEQTLEKEKDQGDKVKTLLAPLAMALFLVNYLLELFDFSILLSITSW
jgi:hypothetical protein